jgi:hypothetical protein
VEQQCRQVPELLAHNTRDVLLDPGCLQKEKQVKQQQQQGRCWLLMSTWMLLGKTSFMLCHGIAINTVLLVMRKQGQARRGQQAGKAKYELQLMLTEDSCTMQTFCACCLTALEHESCMPGAVTSTCLYQS